MGFLDLQLPFNLPKGIYILIQSIQKIQLGAHSQLAAVNSTHVCVGNLFILEVIYEFDSYSPQTSR